MTEEEIETREQIRIKNLEELKEKIIELKKEKKRKRNRQLSEAKRRVPEIREEMIASRVKDNRRREDLRRSQGLCVDCGRRKAPEGFMTCRTCRARRNGTPIPENEEVVVQAIEVEKVKADTITRNLSTLREERTSKRTNAYIRKEAMRIELGLCTSCGKLSEEGRLLCQKCLDRARDANRKHKFGLGRSAYIALLKRQSNTCAICGRTQQEVESVRRLHVDHDHKTGQVRALLCCNCNHGIGCFRDDPELMKKAASYLELHKKEADNA